MKRNIGIITVFLMAGVVSVLAGCSGSNPQNTSEPNAPPPVPAARLIKGTVSYAGSVNPTHQIIVVATRVGEQAPASSTVLKQPGAYTLSNISDGSYSILAFMDLGDDMGAPEANEPSGFYDPNGDGMDDKVEMTGGQSVSNIDIVLKDK